MAIHEARLRIKTKNQNLTVFSTQDIVECSNYSQGCEGGFPYLVAGKYAEDYGIVDESCEFILVNFVKKNFCSGFFFMNFLC